MMDEPLVIKSARGKDIFRVSHNGDLILRGQVVGKDEELAEILSEVGRTLKAVEKAMGEFNAITDIYFNEFI